MDVHGGCRDGAESWLSIDGRMGRGVVGSGLDAITATEDSRSPALVDLTGLQSIGLLGNVW